MSGELATLWNFQIRPTGFIVFGVPTVHLGALSIPDTVRIKQSMTYGVRGTAAGFMVFSQSIYGTINSCK
jgi:hypothetical protein